MDRVKDKLFGVKIHNFPPIFLEEIKNLGLAQAGIWQTYAPNTSIAQMQVADFIKMMTKETIDPAVLEVEATKKVKQVPVKWNGLQNR